MLTIIFLIFRLKFIVFIFEISRHANLVMLWSMLRTGKKKSCIPTSELLIQKTIVYGHFYALRIYISVNFNNLIVMSKILTGKLQNKNTQEISYMNNYIVYFSALPLAQLLFH